MSTGVPPSSSKNIFEDRENKPPSGPLQVNGPSLGPLLPPDRSISHDRLNEVSYAYVIDVCDALAILMHLCI
jgi:hypothetical protein